MAAIDNMDIKSLFAEENRKPLNKQEALKEALEYSEKCSHNSLLARMDAAHALQKASAIRLAV